MGVMELQVDANAAIEIIGRQGLGKVRHLDLSYLWIQAAVRRKQIALQEATNWQEQWRTVEQKCSTMIRS